ncbi:MAG: AraC family transcriptional regulator [Ruminococcus sp.]|nr:AraC family transcriptional regulator [Ruminococcus sp.]
MKINKIILNCRGSSSSDIAITSCFSLFLFRSPVVFRVNGLSKTFSGTTAFISGGNTPHFRSVNRTTLKYEYINFSPSTADRQYILSLNIPLDTPVEINNDFVIANTIKSMKAKSLNRGKHYEEFMSLSMRIILMTISEMLFSDTDFPDVPRYAELKKIRQDIFDNPMREWTADDICYEMDISRAYFHRIYYSAFGTTYRQDVISSRILYASEMLKNTNFSVSKIAEICGYDSPSYFMKQFRQHMNCTPSDYRKKAKNEEQ